MTRHHAIRFAIFQILLAIAFVCILFLIDARWGDTPAQWSAIIFVMVNGSLVAIWVSRAVLRVNAENDDSQQQ